VSKTGKPYSPEFKEVAIWLIHSSEDPHLVSGHISARASLTSQTRPYVGEGMFLHVTMREHCKTLLEDHSRCWRLAYGARFP
jgi:hypothetical protein